MVILTHCGYTHIYSSIHLHKIFKVTPILMLLSQVHAEKYFPQQNQKHPWKLKKGRKFFYRLSTSPSSAKLYGLPKTCKPDTHQITVALLQCFEDN